ncbi:hypothetical protein HW555_009544 [Spodoptera exigua]|uniref:Uncharacterized protein n=1 Tax=Spodoptera exigua TaxID=7107 RepID=A0A835L6P1_SPOEX|nr:hypothetical protein HW555_009544 [Spodoptera exigua]
MMELLPTLGRPTTPTLCCWSCVEALNGTAGAVLRRYFSHASRLERGTKSALFSTRTRRLPASRTASSTCEQRVPGTLVYRNYSFSCLTEM